MNKKTHLIFLGTHDREKLSIYVSMSPCSGFALVFIVKVAFGKVETKRKYNDQSALSAQVVKFFLFTHHLQLLIL